VVQVGQHEIMYIDERTRMRGTGDTAETELPERTEPSMSGVRSST
jgi:hypothetical protein